MASKKRPATLTPRRAYTFDQICSLHTDNHETPRTWLMLDVGVVTLCNQRNGEEPTAEITIKRRDFERLVDWYNRAQRCRRKS